MELSPSSEQLPDPSELVLQTMAMPADANPGGDIFGGWLLAQMDLGGGVVAQRRAGGRLATVAVEAMKFHRPVLVGDLVTCYGQMLRVGRTSIGVKVQIWVRRQGEIQPLKVTEGVFTYVALDEQRRPRPVDPAPARD
jgi:acyl-CoA thioesterase YciA